MIEDEGAIMISEGLKINSTLTELNLGGDIKKNEIKKKEMVDEEKER